MQNAVRLFRRRPRGTVRTTFSLSILGLLLSANVIGSDTSYVKLDIADALVEDNDRGGSVLTIWTEDPIIEYDRIILRGGTFRRGFLGEHNIATIEFLPKQTGSTEVTLGDVLLLAGDGEGTPVPTSDSLYASADAFVYDENTDLSTVELSTTERAATDLNGNGRVDLADVSAFMGAWANRNRVFDFNGDGMMTFRDFSILLADVFTG